jgi:predicted NBD/HSP70 family sugar kinase
VAPARRHADPRYARFAHHRGPPGRAPLLADATPGRRIGVDLGGTKIEGVLLAPEGEELARLRVPTPQNDYAATLTAVAHVISRLDAPEASVGIGAPGSQRRETDPEGRPVWGGANSTWINGQPLALDLATVIGRPVTVANDANCFAVSEATDGSAAGAAVVFGVILGTGVGGGIVVNGRPLAGHHGIAGEWGHTTLPWAKPEDRSPRPCFCGHPGCIESFLSGPAFEQDHLARGGRPMRATEIALSHEPAAVAALDA